jgi:hypothetical protein
VCPASCQDVCRLAGSKYGSSVPLQDGFKVTHDGKEFVVAAVTSNDWEADRKGFVGVYTGRPVRLKGKQNGTSSTQNHI